MKCPDCHTELTEETKDTLWLDAGKPFHLDRFCRQELIQQAAKHRELLRRVLTRLDEIDEYWLVKDINEALENK